MGRERAKRTYIYQILSLSDLVVLQTFSLLLHTHPHTITFFNKMHFSFLLFRDALAGGDFHSLCEQCLLNPLYTHFVRSLPVLRCAP